MCVMPEQYYVAGVIIFHPPDSRLYNST